MNFQALAYLLATAAGVSPTGAADPVKSTVPVCALLDSDKVPRAALLEARLLADSQATWVERAQIDKVLKEQELQAMFSPQGVGQRVRLGKLLKADVLVMVRPVKDAKEPTLELVVSETTGGLRLLVRAVPITKNPDSDLPAMLAAVREGLSKHRETVKEVIAVPSFASNDLEFTYDHLKGAFAKLVESAALDRKGIAVVELAEAEALAKEIALAPPGTTLNRPLPVYLLGEFRNEGKGDKRTVTLKLRAERGGKLIGKADTSTVAPDRAPKALREWATGVLDTLAKDDGPRPPADAKAEAKVLAERARMLARLGSAEASLALIEASLLLDANQAALHAEAVRVLSAIVSQEGVRGLFAKDEDLERTLRFQRRSLAHLETFHVKAERILPHRLGGRDFTVDFQRASDFLAVAPKSAGKVNWRVQEYRDVERETLRRIICLVTRKSADSNEQSVNSGYAWIIALHLPEREKYQVLEEIILELKDLPNPVERSMDYARGGNVLDTPEYRAFIGRLAASKDKNLQEVATRLRQRLEQAKTPGQPDPPSGGPGPGGVKLTPITLTFEGVDKYASREVRGFLSVAPGVDVVWTANAFYLMNAKGSLRLLSRNLSIADKPSVVFDGKYVWAAMSSLGHNPRLLVVDPTTEKLWDISDAEGLPQVNQKGGAFSNAMVTALQPGRVCLVGGWSNQAFFRGWVATVTFDPIAGKAKADVILEAKEAPDRADEKFRTNTRIGFTPYLMATLADAAGADGKPVRRVVIGRNESALVPQLREHPLLVDPDRRTVEAMNVKVLAALNSGQPLVLGGSMYGLRYESKALNKICGQLVRISLPGLTPEIVADDLPPPVNKDSWLVVHDDRIHVVVERAIKVVEKPSSEPGGRPIKESVKLFDWWVVGMDGKNKRLVASEIPALHSVQVSSHYGIVASTMGSFPDFPKTLYAVEIVEQTPKK